MGIGGPIDVVFRGHRAYALVTLVGPDVGGSAAVGIYRIDDPTHSTLVADIGAFNLAHPPSGCDGFVPTGLAVRGRTAYMAEAGLVPHLPENGKIVSFGSSSGPVRQVANGARLLVDVEFGRRRTLFALAQGIFGGGDPGSPALHDTGSLVRDDGHGHLVEVVDGLDQPTPMEIVGTTAYVVTLGGEIWTVNHISGPPFATAH